ncbi:MAG: hypothetical protein ACLQBA_20155, partial [Candidatus Binataceae bacterium]
MLYELTAPPHLFFPISIWLQRVISLAAKIASFHCTRSAALMAGRLGLRPAREGPSSSAFICLHSRHIAAVIVSPISKPASSARLRNASISLLSGTGSLKLIASFSCLRFKTPIALLLPFGWRNSLPVRVREDQVLR